METIKQLSNTEIEITTTQERKQIISKERLLAQKARIEALLLEFEK